MTARSGWSADDVLRYHLAIGAGAPECAGAELRYVYEDVLHVLPTFAAAVASPACKAVVRSLGLDPSTLVHGEQAVTVFAPLPVAASARHTGRVAAVRAAGRSRLVDVVVDTALEDGTVVARSRFGLLTTADLPLAPDGADTAAGPAPAGAPDLVVRVPTLPQQAALYRLSGDRARVHIDPAVAASFGLPRPTLPGLCTWAMVAKAVVDHALDGDVGALTGFAARFTGPVFPGETLAVSLWRDQDGTDAIAVRADVVERGAPALGRGRVAVRAPRPGLISP